MELELPPPLPIPTDNNQQTAFTHLNGLFFATPQTISGALGIFEKVAWAENRSPADGRREGLAMVRQIVQRLQDALAQDALAQDASTTAAERD